MLQDGAGVGAEARIVLACADGLDNKVVAARQQVTQQMVGKWRARFVEHRLDGLLNAPRSGTPRTIDDARIDAMIAKTLQTTPVGATHWRTRSMAQAIGLSQSVVSRVWRLRAAAASPGDLQALDRSDVRGQGGFNRSTQRFD